VQNSAGCLANAHRSPRSNQRLRRRAGGCDFAVDPELRGDQTTVIWLPRYNPRMTTLIHVDPGLYEGPTFSQTKSAITRRAPEGNYVDLTATTPRHQALVPRYTDPSHPVAVVLPLDDLFEDRIDTALQIWRTIRRGTRVAAAPFTAQRRRRLKLLLRALDAALLGVGYREIARGLFGDRVPDGAEWRNHPLRAQTIRLVKDGRALMRGGYLRLLRPDRRTLRRRAPVRDEPSCASGYRDG